MKKKLKKKLEILEIYDGEIIDMNKIKQKNTFHIIKKLIRIGFPRSRMTIN